MTQAGIKHGTLEGRTLSSDSMADSPGACQEVLRACRKAEPPVILGGFLWLGAKATILLFCVAWRSCFLLEFGLDENWDAVAGTFWLNWPPPFWN